MTSWVVALGVYVAYLLLCVGSLMGLCSIANAYLKWRATGRGKPWILDKTKKKRTKKKKQAKFILNNANSLITQPTFILLVYALAKKKRRKHTKLEKPWGDFGREMNKKTKILKGAKKPRK